MIDLIEDISLLTTICKRNLNRLTNITSMSIAHSILEEAMAGNDDICHR